MTKAGRASIFVALLALVVGLCVFTAMAFLRSNPPTVDFTTNHAAGEPVHLTFETVGSIGFGPHPTWVSYLVEDPQGQWVHSTLWQLPAHTKVDVTWYQFDSGSPIRNPENGLVTGIPGDKVLLNGKTTFSLLNSYAGSGIAHTFSIPSLGINVPGPGVPGTPSNFCNTAPCLPQTEAHETLQFSFTTPGPGQYRFQCFEPCGLSYLFGNGGPMSTISYMGGFLEVV